MLFQHTVITDVTMTPASCSFFFAISIQLCMKLYSHVESIFVPCHVNTWTCTIVHSARLSLLRVQTTIWIHLYCYGHHCSLYSDLAVAVVLCFVSLICHWVLSRLALFTLSSNSANLRFKGVPSKFLVGVMELISCLVSVIISWSKYIRAVSFGIVSNSSSTSLCLLVFEHEQYITECEVTELMSWVRFAEFKYFAPASLVLAQLLFLSYSLPIPWQSMQLPAATAIF